MKKLIIIIAACLGILSLIILKSVSHNLDDSDKVAILLNSTKQSEIAMNKTLIAEENFSNILNVIKSDPSLVQKEDALNHLVNMKTDCIEFIDKHLAAENNSKQILLGINEKLLEADENDHYLISKLNECKESNERLYETQINLIKRFNDYLADIDSLINLCKESADNLSQN